MLPTLLTLLLLEESGLAVGGVSGGDLLSTTTWGEAGLLVSVLFWRGFLDLAGEANSSARFFSSSGSIVSIIQGCNVLYHTVLMVVFFFGFLRLTLSVYLLLGQVSVKSD